MKIWTWKMKLIRTASWPHEDDNSIAESLEELAKEIRARKVTVRACLIQAEFMEEIEEPPEGKWTELPNCNYEQLPFKK